MKGKQYTIRGIPEKLDAVLREEAATTGKSLNTLLIDKLNQSCQLTDEPRKNDDFSEFAGTMDEDPAFDAAVAFFDGLDWEEWK